MIFATVFSFLACSSGPEAEGASLAKEFCSAYKSALSSDPAKAMSLMQTWAGKSQSAASKYATEPDKMQKFLNGYTTEATSCK
jgi:hypothetical protein